MQYLVSISISSCFINVTLQFVCFSQDSNEALHCYLFIGFLSLFSTFPCIFFFPFDLQFCFVILLLKKLLVAYRVSHSLNFTDHTQVVRFEMFLCLLSFLFSTNLLTLKASSDSSLFLFVQYQINGSELSQHFKCSFSTCLVYCPFFLYQEYILFYPYFNVFTIQSCIHKQIILY